MSDAGSVPTRGVRYLGIVAAGTVPIADPDTLKVTPDPRYEHMQGEYRMLVREQLICGTQVHLDVNDRDLAVAVAHRVAPWLPALLALSAARQRSAYSRGGLRKVVDTLLAETRANTD